MDVSAVEQRMETDAADATLHGAVEKKKDLVDVRMDVLVEGKIGIDIYIDNIE
jgi:hypothetical protein